MGRRGPWWLLQHCRQHRPALRGCKAALASSKLHPDGPSWSVVAAAASQAAQRSPPWLYGSSGFVQAASRWAFVVRGGCCSIAGSTAQPSVAVKQLWLRPSCTQMGRRGPWWLLQHRRQHRSAFRGCMAALAPLAETASLWASVTLRPWLFKAPCVRSEDAHHNCPSARQCSVQGGEHSGSTMDACMAALCTHNHIPFITQAIIHLY